MLNHYSLDKHSLSIRRIGSLAVVLKQTTYTNAINVHTNVCAVFNLTSSFESGQGTLPESPLE